MPKGGGLTFDDEEIDRILAAISPFEGLSNNDPGPSSNDWDELRNLRRTQIKTALHGLFMTEYLRDKVAPQGLIVRNKPFIFQTDKEFKRDWSLISWHCTRDWLVLMIKTATRISQEQKVAIQRLEVQLKTYQSTSVLKKRLEELNQEMNEFETMLKKSKYNKLKKDKERFTHEKAYPYTRDDYVSKNYNSDRDSDTFDASSTGSNLSRDYLPRNQRGNQRYSSPYNPRQRGWGNYQGPPVFQPYQYGPSPMGAPFQQWAPEYDYGYYGPLPFLGQCPGPRRGRNKRGQNVHWATGAPGRAQMSGQQPEA